MELIYKLFSNWNNIYKTVRGTCPSEEHVQIQNLSHHLNSCETPSTLQRILHMRSISSVLVYTII